MYKEGGERSPDSPGNLDAVLGTGILPVAAVCELILPEGSTIKAVAFGVLALAAGKLLYDLRRDGDI